jgi:hypothetical protein
MTKLTIADIADQATIDVPTAGRLLGIGRDAAYAAAAAGQIPVLKLGGRRLRVPVPRLLALLGVDSSEPSAPENDDAGVGDPGNRLERIRRPADRHGHDDADSG